MSEMVSVVTNTIREIRGQVWALVTALALTGAIMALGIIYLAPTNGGFEERVGGREDIASLDVFNVH